jgi:cystinosin
MFLLAYNYNDWSSIFGSPTKLGLGLLSIFFDLIFMTQHYILYNTRTRGHSYEPIS